MANKDPQDQQPGEPPKIEIASVPHFMVKSSIGLARGGMGHRLINPGEVLSYDDLGLDEKERGTCAMRLLDLGAIERI